MEKHLNRIGTLAHKETLRGKEFESLIHQALCEELPFCVLCNVAMYDPAHFEPCGDNHGAMAYEIDNLLHYRQEGFDHIVVVETKKHKIEVDNSGWWIRYTDSQSGRSTNWNARKQIENHLRTLQRYLRPVGAQVELKFKALLVSSDLRTPRLFPGEDDAEWFGMCSYRDLPQWLDTLKNSGKEPPKFLRVAQSEFLNRFRLGIPVPALGHPELRHAINYVDRCRREIDRRFFGAFKPTHRYWAISGAAGMGKSVLLAYAGAVIASGRALADDGRGGLKLVPCGTNSGLGLVPLNDRKLCIFAMKPKQRQVLEDFYWAFVRQFSEQTPSGELNFLKPRFGVWDDRKAVPAGCNVLLLDEAHDLSETGQARIREWHQDSKTNYLIVACDRHQKIELNGPSATIIEGIDFTGRSTCLRRNYRNPFPVYAASLALMFRWFASSGPKVIPSSRQLREWLGFDVASLGNGGGRELCLRNDSHPANAWSHCIAEFDTCEAAYAQLIQQNLNKSEILWVRFGPEDLDFDYEQLSGFTYHNFYSPESASLVDKYVKGQEFPVVVIEGFPEKMDTTGVWHADPKAMDPVEYQMWSFRRELYLCASRATCFLYFICGQGGSEPVKRIQNEVREIIRTLSVPMDPGSASGKRWRLMLHETSQQRNLKDYNLFGSQSCFTEIRPFADRVPASRNVAPHGGSQSTGERRPASVVEPAKPPLSRKVNFRGEIRVKSLAAVLAVKASSVISELAKLHIKAEVNDIVPETVAAAIANERGVILRKLSPPPTKSAAKPEP